MKNFKKFVKVVVMDYIANLIHFAITGDFTTDRYRDFIRAALERFLPYSAQLMPSACQSVEGCVEG